ncbi:MAG: bifunctional methylenetetrahydrofolate dehydrogenase/methenyltetrahydrofolate cyclohydrolase FolD [Deltaproteobacteria bacterium]|nr:bifunctional methylenetetrahydrofolate dehydrogenase/methenyltetrahydrofolate cyclohydrolase FolD [Deltaproteobacteria bacterium]
MGRILDGKAVAAELRGRVAVAAGVFASRAGRKAGLEVVLVGEDPASQVYVRNKARACEEAGLRGVVHRLPADTTQGALLELVHGLGARDDVDGILVQLPLPKHLHEDAVLQAVPADKDVDGFHLLNAGALFTGREGLVPCTPTGCMRLLDHAGGDLSGARAVVVGRSNIVGKPMAMLLLARHATVTLAHSRTRDLGLLCATADILIAAVGRAGLVRGDWVRPGAIVIDVGINRDAQGKLVGDVAFDEAAERAAWITPVPGGVGPMTIACLLENTLRAAWRRKGLPPGELTL